MFIIISVFSVFVSQQQNHNLCVILMLMFYPLSCLDVLLRLSTTNAICTYIKILFGLYLHKMKCMHVCI